MLLSLCHTHSETSHLSPFSSPHHHSDQFACSPVLISIGWRDPILCSLNHLCCSVSQFLHYLTLVISKISEKNVSHQRLSPSTRHWVLRNGGNVFMNSCRGNTAPIDSICTGCCMSCTLSYLSDRRLGGPCCHSVLRPRDPVKTEQQIRTGAVSERMQWHQTLNCLLNVVTE